ncbi:hypothetical protein [Aureimonas sp. AU20]|uniref:hypothetical protein n=1 Tax=Aureimonas sp. AU20 TaxID=1349819 RepID=UPI00071F6356|nr:hypothetical protein [Aureimonas sp. AU20]ALN74945.1 hypothetical protein M673_19655 [Aureimonas sp. AU20]
MTTEEAKTPAPPLSREWPFPLAAALGSAVRAKGIEREIRARLPFPLRAALEVEAGSIRFSLPASEAPSFETGAAVVADVLAGVASLPVLPGEVEDILTILPRERLKWTKDGRLRSAGTRTVKLRGRAKAVTFHVFDPKEIEDCLDRDLPALWREADAEASAENRARAAGKAAQTRAAAKSGEAKASKRKPRAARGKTGRSELKDWEVFEAEGFLR